MSWFSINCFANSAAVIEGFFSISSKIFLWEQHVAEFEDFLLWSLETSYSTAKVHVFRQMCKSIYIYRYCLFTFFAAALRARMVSI